MTPIEQHQREIHRNLKTWNSKPLLRQIYGEFYQSIIAQIDENLAGSVVEIGSGIGNLKSHYPRTILTDLFPNPWIDQVCDAYNMPFANSSISHLILFDVFHHLRAPKAFFKEAKRVLVKSGRVILFEPYISLLSYPAYEFFHHEGVHWREPIFMGESLPGPQDYYTGQGNATRLFFRKEAEFWTSDWQVIHKEALAAFRYLLSGGYSKTTLYPEAFNDSLKKLEKKCANWPRLFGSRCLIVLQFQ